MDLTTVDRAVLIAIIAELQAVIERLQRRIAELEGQAKPGGPLRMPGLKAKSARKPPAQQEPRKQRRHGFARPRMTPTHRVEHVMENCPDCGAHLSGGIQPTFLQKERLPGVPTKAIQKARRKGMSLRAIERELGIHTGTIKKYLVAEGPPTRQSRVVSSTSSSDTIPA